MCSIAKFAKVEGHTSLVRDMSSRAILSEDDDEFKSFQNRRAAEKNRIARFKEQSQTIESLKSEMAEMKQMLNKLLSNQG